LAGAVALGATMVAKLGTAGPAEASHGSFPVGAAAGLDTIALHVGTTNAAPAETRLTRSAAGPVLTVQNQDVTGTLATTGTPLASGVQGSSGFGIGVLGVSGTGLGVFGTSTSGAGVSGSSTNFLGVYGRSDNSAGVFGQATASAGVYGTSPVYGAWGQTTNGYGVYGQATGAGVGVYGQGGQNGGLAGFFQGNVFITGQLYVNGVAVTAAGAQADGARAAGTQAAPPVTRVKEIAPPVAPTLPAIEPPKHEERKRGRDDAR